MCAETQTKGKKRIPVVFLSEKESLVAHAKKELARLQALFGGEQQLHEAISHDSELRELEVALKNTERLIRTPVFGETEDGKTSRIQERTLEKVQTTQRLEEASAKAAQLLPENWRSLVSEVLSLRKQISELV